jgi:hypothetical protein
VINNWVGAALEQLQNGFMNFRQDVCECLFFILIIRISASGNRFSEQYSFLSLRYEKKLK